MASSMSLQTNSSPRPDTTFPHIYARHVLSRHMFNSIPATEPSKQNVLLLYLFAILCIACCLILMESAPHKDVQDLELMKI